MPNKKLKKIMTDLAAGHITKQEADKLIKPKKVAEKAPKREIEEEQIHTELNKKEVKQSHRHI